MDQIWCSWLKVAICVTLAALALTAENPTSSILLLQPEKGLSQASSCFAVEKTVITPTLRLIIERAGRLRLPGDAHTPDASCSLAGTVHLQNSSGHSVQTWAKVDACGASLNEQWLDITTSEPCQQCRLTYQPPQYHQAPGVQAWSACVTITPQQLGKQGKNWLQRVAGHFIHSMPAAGRRLLQDDYSTPAIQSVGCAGTGSLVTGYEGCLYVIGQYPEPPDRKHWVHWNVVEGGVEFAVEVAPRQWGCSWAGLGWSPQGPASHPPQMINATSVIGWVDLDGHAHVGVFNLWSKNVVDIRESYDQFWVTDTSIQYIDQGYLVLRFRRSFDTVFNPDMLQRMITAHGHSIRALSQHGHRAALYMNTSGTGSMWKTPTRLNNKKVQAHAWCMFIAFGIILPIGIIWARYFRDVFGKWYLIHLGIQVFGLLLAIAAFLVAITQSNPIPRSLAHFQLGLAVIILAVLQPLNSIPRLTMHHAHVMRSVWWAYLHWLFGRATIAFAWVNMFLGVGRYRTWFNLGSWPEAALGLYFGAIILVCTILESRMWRKGDLRSREENDELSRRIAELEDYRAHSSGRESPVEGKPLRQAIEEDDLLDQMTTRHTASAAPQHTDHQLLLDDDELLYQDQPREFDSAYSRPGTEQAYKGDKDS